MKHLRDPSHPHVLQCAGPALRQDMQGEEQRCVWAEGLLSFKVPWILVNLR